MTKSQKELNSLVKLAKENAVEIFTGKLLDGFKRYSYFRDHRANLNAVIMAEKEAYLAILAKPEEDREFIADLRRRFALHDLDDVLIYDGEDKDISVFGKYVKGYPDRFNGNADPGTPGTDPYFDINAIFLRRKDGSIGPKLEFSLERLDEISDTIIQKFYND